jgi:hypothetical protein
MNRLYQLIRFPYSDQIISFLEIYPILSFSVSL